MVDEQIAKAWGKLKQYDYAAKYTTAPPHGWWWCYGHEIVPDPATQPWEWVKALCQRDYMGEIGMCDAPTVTKPATFAVRLWNDKSETVEGKDDTPEAALEAAIRAWEASHAD